MSLQPVYDAETPRCERDDDSASMQKHRAFDNPWALKVILLLHLSPPFLISFKKKGKERKGAVHTTLIVRFFPTTWLHSMHTAQPTHRAARFLHVHHA